MADLSINKCSELLLAAAVEPIPGRTADESARTLCLAAVFHKAASEELTPEVFAGMRKSRWPGLAKAVAGGFQHAVSVDNGAVYAELWSKGENWYAVSGAGVHQIDGVKKGMDARDAVPLFLKAVFADGTTRKRCCD